MQNPIPDFTSPIYRFLYADGATPGWTRFVSSTYLRGQVSELENRHRLTEKFISDNFCQRQLTSLAQRLINSRDHNSLKILRRYWTCFGSDHATVDEIANHQRDFLSSVSWFATGDPESVRYQIQFADYTEGICDIAERDPGVLGNAIRQSSFCQPGQRFCFPAIFSHTFPGVTSQLMVSLQEHADESLAGFDELVKSVKQAFRRNLDDSMTFWRPDSPFVKLCSTIDDGIELDSAGMSVAVQAITTRSEWQIPHGIGFTGSWTNKGLTGVVGGLRRKVIAAKDHGLFLLFACVSSHEQRSLLAEDLQGVSVFFVPEGLRLEQLCNLVSEVCSRSGLTHNAWQQSQQRFVLPRHDFPNAYCDDAKCPVGFVGRHTAIGRLSELDLTEPGIRIVLAPARSGKTTLLSQFAVKITPYPIWFAFDRNAPSRQFLSDCLHALRVQLAARHDVLDTDLSRHEDTDEAFVKRTLEQMLVPVIVIDGLDESREVEQTVEFMKRISTQTTLIVGTQPLKELRFLRSEQVHIPEFEGVETRIEDAKRLVRKYARRFEGESRAKLESEEWCHGLSVAADANLWVITEYLEALVQDRMGWPNSPWQAQLSGDVDDYCHGLVDDVLMPLSDDEQYFAREFIATLVHLGGQQPIELVRNCAGINRFPASQIKGTLDTLSRLLSVSATHCRFHSAFVEESLREKVFNHSGPDVVRALVDAVETEARDGRVELASSRLLPLLVQSGAYDSAARLFENPTWLFERVEASISDSEKLRMLEQQVEQVDSPNKTYASAIAMIRRWLPEIRQHEELLPHWWAVFTGGPIPDAKPCLLVPEPHGYQLSSTSTKVEWKVIGHDFDLVSSDTSDEELWIAVLSNVGILRVFRLTKGEKSSAQQHLCIDCEGLGSSVQIVKFPIALIATKPKKIRNGQSLSYVSSLSVVNISTGEILSQIDCDGDDYEDCQVEDLFSGTEHETIVLYSDNDVHSVCLLHLHSSNHLFLDWSGFESPGHLNFEEVQSIGHNIIRVTHSIEKPPFSRPLPSGLLEHTDVINLIQIPTGNHSVTGGYDPIVSWMPNVIRTLSTNGYFYLVNVELDTGVAVTSVCLKSGLVRSINLASMFGFDDFQQHIVICLLSQRENDGGIEVGIVREIEGEWRGDEFVLDEGQLHVVAHEELAIKKGKPKPPVVEIGSTLTTTPEKEDDEDVSDAVPTEFRVVELEGFGHLHVSTPRDDYEDGISIIPFGCEAPNTPERRLTRHAGGVLVMDLEKRLGKSYSDVLSCRYHAHPGDAGESIVDVDAFDFHKGVAHQRTDASITIPFPNAVRSWPLPGGEPISRVFRVGEFEFVVLTDAKQAFLLPHDSESALLLDDGCSSVHTVRDTILLFLRNSQEIAVVHNGVERFRTKLPIEADEVKLMRDYGNYAEIFLRMKKNESAPKRSRASHPLHSLFAERYEERSVVLSLDSGEIEECGHGLCHDPTFSNPTVHSWGDFVFEAYRFLTPERKYMRWSAASRELLQVHLEELDDRDQQYAFLGPLIISLEEGKVEVRDIRKPEDCLAVGFIDDQVQSLVALENELGKFVVAAGSRLTWFRL